jgi:NADPH:quinone reductase-like Zn-dependent oxidoreductase
LVEAVGAQVEGVAVGDRVCGMTGLRLGAHAEQLVTHADRLVQVPVGVTDDEAAGVLFGGTTALCFLRDKVSLEKGCSVLVNGASGAIGTIAVQLAARAGTGVTGVTSRSNAALVTELGADDVIDHQHEDLAGTTARFDVVLDTVGNLTVESGRRLLAPGGRLLLAVATLGQTLRARGDVGAGTSRERPADMAYCSS